VPAFRAHGANPDKLYSALKVEPPERVYDFSTNANVVPWNGDFDIELRKVLAEYPDDESSALRALIAQREGCCEKNILITNGSNEAIYILASLMSDRLNHIWEPVYGEYVTALDAWGAEREFIFDLSSVSGGCGAVWLCNPCNPTGTWTPDSKLADVIGRSPEAIFIVDEAYIDFLSCEREGLSPLKHPNAVILRSLTKIYHLCGARIGYVVADERKIDEMKKRQPTWSVNGVAQAAALAFLRDESFLAKTRNFYLTETPRFISLLCGAGCEVLPTSVNFFLVKTDNDEELIRFLLERGLVVRHTRNFPGLDGRYIRIATRLPDENELLAAALSEFNS
jgi:threonine-phosphate decarboxylase